MERLADDILNRQGCLMNGVYICVIVAVVFLFSACATKKIEYVDREVVRYVTKVEKDTFVNNVHDSVYFEVIQKGDTVFKTKYKEKYIYLDRVQIKTDTCWRDSVVTEYKESVKEVTKIPKIFWYSMVFSVIVIIFAIIKLVRWLQIH